MTSTLRIAALILLLPPVLFACSTSTSSPEDLLVDSIPDSVSNDVLDLLDSTPLDTDLANTLQFARSAPDSENYPVPRVSDGDFPDVFHPNFEPACQEYAAKTIPGHCIDNPWCIGTFIDNELRWHGQDFLVPADNWNNSR